MLAVPGEARMSEGIILSVVQPSPTAMADPTSHKAMSDMQLSPFSLNLYLSMNVNFLEKNGMP
jgi:hypothetical protein